MTESETFETFMRSYQNMVFSTALRLIGTEAEAQDVAQDVFLKAYERFHDLKDNPAAGGWLKTVARNQSLNYLSRYRKRWHFFSDFFSAEEGEREEQDFAAPGDLMTQLGDSDRLRLLEVALMQLPDAQRVPLVLYHFEGLSYEEIAERMRASLGKVKTDISRGREALRRKLRLSEDGDLEWAHMQSGKSSNNQRVQRRAEPGGSGLLSLI
jgi:RNA polymerase sigma-70 factor (ECF subfamily)